MAKSDQLPNRKEQPQTWKHLGKMARPCWGGGKNRGCGLVGAPCWQRLGEAAGEGYCTNAGLLAQVHLKPFPCPELLWKEEVK